MALQPAATYSSRCLRPGWQSCSGTELSGGIHATAALPSVKSPFPTPCGLFELGSEVDNESYDFFQVASVGPGIGLEDVGPIGAGGPAAAARFVSLQCRALRRSSSGLITQPFPAGLTFSSRPSGPLTQLQFLRCRFFTNLPQASSTEACENLLSRDTRLANEQLRFHKCGLRRVIRLDG